MSDADLLTDLLGFNVTLGAVSWTTIIERNQAEQHSMKMLQLKAIELAELALPEQLADKELHQMCVDWVKWEHSKKLFCRCPSIGILGKMQPSRQGAIPDHVLNYRLAFFHMAFTGMEDNKEKAAFILFYRLGVRNVKKFASQMGITRQTFYNYVKKFRREVYIKSLFMKRAYDLDRLELLRLKG